MLRSRMFGLIVCLSLAVAPEVESGQYVTDPAQLPTEAQSLYRVAKGVMDNGIWDNTTLEKGELATEELIRLAPNFLPIYIQKARLAMVRGTLDYEVRARNEEAERIVLEVIAKDAGYANSYVLLAGIYMNLEAYEEAQESLKTASRIGTDDPWLQCNWARLRRAQERNAEAYKAALACLELATAYPKAAAMAIGHLDDVARHGQTPSAQRDIAGFIFESYDDPLDRIAIARWLISASDGYDGQIAYALQVIMRQRAETPDMPEADLQLARIILKQAGTGEAGYFPSYSPFHAPVPCTSCSP